MHREQSSGKRIGSRRGRQKASGVGSSKERRALLAQTVDLKEERREEKEVGDSLFLALNSVIFLENVLVFQAAVTKHHKRGGLQQENFILSDSGD